MKSDNYFMKLAFHTSNQSTCYSNPKGAIIIHANKIVASGFNNVSPGVLSCREKMGCYHRRALGYQSGEGLLYCRGVHAEAAAICNAAKIGVSIDGATLYTTHFPCNECAKLIANSGISRVVYANEYSADYSLEIFLGANIRLDHLIMG